MNYADWQIGLTRYRRLREALGFAKCGTSLSLVNDAHYNDLCHEFRTAIGQLFSHLSQPEFSWMDGDHILAMYRAWQVKHG